MSRDVQRRDSSALRASETRVPWQYYTLYSVQRLVSTACTAAPVLSATAELVPLKQMAGNAVGYPDLPAFHGKQRGFPLNVNTTMMPSRTLVSEARYKCRGAAGPLTELFTVCPLDLLSSAEWAELTLDCPLCLNYNSITISTWRPIKEPKGGLSSDQ